MTKKIIEQIKDDLHKRREQITIDLENISASDNKEAKFPEYGDKPDENAQEVGDYVTNIATEKSLETTLRDIDKALERIKNSTYGICNYCKKKINERRLVARPVANACMECKTRLQS